MNRQQRSPNLTVIALSVGAATILTFAAKQLDQIDFFSLQPAYAQRLRIEDIWQQVYQQLPDLPRENQYISKESGEVATDNTLVSRLIRYHIYIKGRPPNYRLDWKLTLADYLSANESISEGVYPGYNTLQENPLAGDRTVIENLTRQQRDELVQALVNVFNPNAASPSTETQPLMPE